MNLGHCPTHKATITVFPVGFLSFSNLERRPRPSASALLPVRPSLDFSFLMAALLLSATYVPGFAATVKSSPLVPIQQRASSVSMGPKLHGSQQSRSPLVNWYAYEAGIELEMQPPRPSNHPFQQVPFLTDDGDVEVFESGAILLYLSDEYGKASSAKERAAYTKWVVWSNSELDGLCFGAVPGDHRVRGTSMNNPSLRSVATLEKILSENEWLVDGEFSVADVAVGAYLNYVRQPVSIPRPLACPFALHPCP